MADIKETVRALSRGTTEIISPELLEQKLVKSATKGTPLVIKAGFDPTAPDIHLGHVVLLRKMKQFQELGHKVIFLIGDFTAQIGDPTGRNELRKKMSRAEVDENARTYREQIFRVLDERRTEVAFNSTWFNGFQLKELMELAARATVAQMLARADFKKRFEEGREISLLEFLYPLLQGYDSVQLQADIELGGTDQKFNLLMGRQMQEAYGQEPQVVLMTPLLEGLDGVQKMSKSIGNYVGIREPAKEMFGKIMSVSDELMWRYYELLTNEDVTAARKLHPKEAKLKLAENVVSQFHGTDEAALERESFERVFAQKQIPDDIPVFNLADERSLPELLVCAGLAPTKNEARRLIKQNAVTFEGIVVTDEGWIARPGVLKVGKRRYLRFV